MFWHHFRSPFWLDFRQNLPILRIPFPRGLFGLLVLARGWPVDLVAVEEGGALAERLVGGRRGGRDGGADGEQEGAPSWRAAAREPRRVGCHHGCHPVIRTVQGTCRGNMARCNWVWSDETLGYRI